MSGWHGPGTPLSVCTELCQEQRKRLSTAESASLQVVMPGPALAWSTDKTATAEPFPLDGAGVRELCQLLLLPALPLPELHGLPRG